MTTFLVSALPSYAVDDPKRPLFLLLVGFILTFLIVRLNTRLTRAHGRSHLRIASIVTPGGLHIHHSIFGLIGMVVFGILEFAVQPGSPWLEVFAFFFGSGVALTLDEFALILHLEDVYWSGEGRKSIDAVILGLTFITLLLTGLLPRSIDEVGGYVAVSRWVGSALILSGAVFVVICYLKGKLFVGTVGIFVPLVAMFGALRLAKPDSPWARRRYAGKRDIMERALCRDDGFHQRWQRRKYWLWDLIGGAPQPYPPRRKARRDGRDPESRGGVSPPDR